MEWMNKLIILIAICVLCLAFSFYFLNRGESSLSHHFLSWFSHDLFCLADPAGLCDNSFSILNIYVFINESSLVIGQEN